MMNPDTNPVSDKRAWILRCETLPVELTFSLGRGERARIGASSQMELMLPLTGLQEEECTVSRDDAGELWITFSGGGRVRSPGGFQAGSYHFTVTEVQSSMPAQPQPVTMSAGREFPRPRRVPSSANPASIPASPDDAEFPGELPIPASAGGRHVIDSPPFDARRRRMLLWAGAIFVTLTCITAGLVWSLNMTYLLLTLPSHIIPLAVVTVTVVLLLRHREAIGRRRVNFGLWGIGLMVFVRIVPGLISEHYRNSEMRGDPSDFRMMLIRNWIIGITSSILWALALWFLFIAVSNRRTVKHD